MVLALEHGCNEGPLHTLKVLERMPTKTAAAFVVTMTDIVGSHFILYAH